MAKTLSLYEAKTRLSALVEEAAAGEEITIAKNGKPEARLVPLPEKPAVTGKRPLGQWRGKVWIADDFDAPWPEDIGRALAGEPDPGDSLDAPPAR
ncbi:type II toxin-antitoxin system Phd/YefM family antitoxin [Benzoatithermus flavus]|uniref:Antitoxin n=1 Tax=Benzoatithermus flavus TaxID=3108223 RepID=A0ABU8XYB1_9PROT